MDRGSTKRVHCPAPPPATTHATATPPTPKWTFYSFSFLKKLVQWEKDRSHAHIRTYSNEIRVQTLLTPYQMKNKGRMVSAPTPASTVSHLFGNVMRFTTKFCCTRIIHKKLRTENFSALILLYLSHKIMHLKLLCSSIWISACNFMKWTPTFLLWFLLDRSCIIQIFCFIQLLWSCLITRSG